MKSIFTTMKIHSFIVVLHNGALLCCVAVYMFLTLFHVSGSICVQSVCCAMD